MAEKKNQHYVPQMHLRYFATDADKKLINLTVLQNQRRLEDKPIKNQASENYFYGQNGVIEDALGRLEDDTASIFESITNDNCLPNKNSDSYYLILLYVLFAKTRTKKQLDKLNDVNNQIFQKILSYSDEFKDIAPDYEIELENPFNLLLTTTMENVHLAMDLECKLIFNETKKPFILSDNPTITYNDFNNQKGHKETNGRGFICKGLQIFFPLSPKHLLFFYDSRIYKFGNRKAKKISFQNDSSVEQINLLQLLNANEVLFYNHDATEEYINNLIEKSTHFSSFDKQSLKELFSSKKEKNGDLRTLISVKTENPKIKLDFEHYKFLDYAKHWKPDTRIVYPRSEWHLKEYQKKNK